MTTYECLIHLTVIAKDGEAVFTKTVRLPFPPHKGLRLEISDDNWNIKVSKVTYSLEQKNFLVHSKLEMNFGCPCTQEDQCCVLNPNDFTDHGWKILEPIRRGYDRIYARDWMFNPDEHLKAKLTHTD